jgi:hypothetical protein
VRTSSPPSRRYTLAFEPAAEAHVAQDLARLSTGLESELGDALRSLLLVGPFARSEGCMARSPKELVAGLPGYELFVVLRRSPERFERVLPAISATWSRLLGTRVALRAVVEATLARPPHTRAYFHAGAGQAIELLADTARPSACAAFAATTLEASERDQLLIESLTALALARLEAPGDARRVLDRARRALLACGDAALLAHGMYASTLSERAEALARAGVGSTLREAYRTIAAASPEPAPDAPAARAAVDALLRTLSSGVLELQAARDGSARAMGPYLRSEPPGPMRDGEPRGWLASALDTLSSRPPPPPPAPVLRACIALALGDGAPESLAFAARALAPASTSTVGPPPQPAQLAAALRRAARPFLAASRTQPFADWALVPEPA